MKPTPPEQFRLTHGLALKRSLNPLIGSDEGYGRNGMFLVPFRTVILRCMISDGAIGVEQGMDAALTDWEHVSVSLPNRCPTWEEMCFAKDLFFTKDEVCVQFHPREEDYVNNHPFCLHIWRHKTAIFPAPPDILVGDKRRGLLHR